MATGAEAKTKRVVSGMRPTGRLHIGHYFGALQNWVRLQNDPSYDCFYFIADWHALTSDYSDTSCIAENTIQIATDYLAAGLDPQNDRCVIFLQSLVPEHAELHLFLSMVTPLGWLERVPTYKEALENVKDKDLHTYGFLGYPVLQTADIVIYSDEGKTLVVPVGEDQVSHVELSREIVRRFNTHIGIEISDSLFNDYDNRGDLKAVASIIDVPVTQDADEQYWKTQIRRAISEIGFDNFLQKLRRTKGGSSIRSGSDLDSEFELKTRRDPSVYFRRLELLQEPEAILTQTPRIPGLDGRKMSKSYGNTIMLSESNEGIWEKVRRMKTDPARQRRENPGNPDICPVYDWHKLFSPPDTLNWAAEGCRTAGIGCIECKREMADNLIKWITPIRERRLHYGHQEELVRRLIREGSVKARRIAQQTMVKVRDAVFGKNRVRRRNLRPAQRP